MGVCLFSVQQLRWFLGSIKFCIFIPGFLRKPCPFPSSLSSSCVSAFWSRDSSAYVWVPCLLCFAFAVVSCSWKLCLVRCACFSYTFQMSSSPLFSLWEDASWWPSFALAITFLKGLHLTQCPAGKAGMLCGSATQNRNWKIYCCKFRNMFCKRNSL